MGKTANEDIEIKIEGLEDDDPNDQDIEIGEEEEINDDDLDFEEVLKGLKNGKKKDPSKKTKEGKKENAEEEEETEEIEEEEPEEDEEDKETDDKKLYSESEIGELVNQRVIAEVNRIIPERLNRDRKANFAKVQRLEKLTGMPIDQVTQTIIDNMVTAKAEELSCSEEDARKIVEKDIKLADIQLEREQEKSQKNEESEVMQQMQYLQDKVAYMQKPKLAKFLKQFEKEIDDFSQNGKILDYATAMNQIIGQKILSGDLLEKMQSGAQQKVLRDNEVKKKKTPPSTASGGNTATVTMTKAERDFIAAMGLDEKEVAKEKLALEKNKQRKGR